VISETKKHLPDHKGNTNTIIISFFAKAKVHQQKQSQS
jgi:hypothetical protein